MVCYTQNFTDNWYAWASNNDSASYPNGEAWYSLDNGSSWGNKSKSKNRESRPKSLSKLDDTNISVDMCFKTYGRNSTQLDIDFKIFGKGLSTTFSNVGSVNATGVYFEVSVKGGMFGNINNTTGGILIPPLEPDGSLLINTSFFGFGMVNITAEAYASNALLTTKEARGFVFLSYIFVIPDFSI